MKLQKFMFLSVFTALLCSNSAYESPSMVVVDISQASSQDIAALKSDPDVQWWTEGGDQMLVASQLRPIRRSFANSLKITQVMAYREPSEMVFIHSAHANEFVHPIPFLFKGGRSMVVLKKDIQNIEDDGHAHFQVVPFSENQVLAERIVRTSKDLRWSNGQVARARKAAGLVKGDRWYSDVTKLAGWNRHITAAGNKDARDFLSQELRKIPGLSVVSQEFSVYGKKAWNVIATQTSRTGNTDTVLVAGHYDSTSQSTSTAAPGAEDNASGAAGVVELARVVAEMKLDLNVIFIAFSGEEEGLIGSNAYVNSLDAAAKARIKAVVNMDMIGYTKDDSLDVLLETSSDFKNLADHLAAAAESATNLHVYRTLNPFGSDHMPFIEDGIPALLTIDNDWGDYPSYHRTSDSIEKVSQAMGLEVLKMNAAAIAAWAP